LFSACIFVKTLENPKVALKSKNFGPRQGEIGRKSYLSSLNTSVNEKRQPAVKYVLIVSGYKVKNRDKTIENEVKMPDAILCPKNESPAGGETPKKKAPSHFLACYFRIGWSMCESQPCLV
jgi:hypothetical protein